MRYFRRDRIPPTDPRLEETVAETEVEDRGYGRMRFVQVACTIIEAVCVLFAVVLGVHILLVLGSANPANGFAQLIDTWASGITLGLSDLFTVGDEKLRVLLNEGLAAILWLAIGALLTTVIARLALPGPERRFRYWRTLRR